MIPSAKFLIFSLLLYLRQYPYHANEFGTSWNHTAAQNGTVGVRISRLLTGEVDMQTPTQTKVLAKPGNGAPKETALPGNNPGKPGSKAGSEKPMPTSSQGKALSEKKENKPKGTEVKNGTDNKRPEQNKAPETPTGDRSKETAPVENSGNSDPAVGSDRPLLASRIKAQVENTTKKLAAFCSALKRIIIMNKYLILFVIVLFIPVTALSPLPLFFEKELLTFLVVAAAATAILGTIFLITLSCLVYRRIRLRQSNKNMTGNTSPQKDKNVQVLGKLEAPEKQKATKKPEAPKNPETPGKTEVPKKPEQPENTEAPGTAGVPKKLEPPKKTEVPEKQGASAKLDATKKPEVPQDQAN
ncbi:hypothetical protein AK88_02992 [Plasmodium fragile]|uniref:Uncharacterized protein n=1 Tax=Plasmodium fragile TaxID=5857 RepID=A0A0D9QKJ4_PLAFR|nr:uncharacterized protein AK88_02992 [Plasmodium fragile]KJP87312.1 hypothetical protein AK88_02992 [Plasmodium fragile]